MKRNNPRLSYFSTGSFVPADQSSSGERGAGHRRSIFGEGSSFAPSNHQEKLYFGGDKTEAARIRGACRASPSSSNPDQSVSEFIRMVVLREVERLEFKHNDGMPFLAPIEEPTI